MRQEYSRLDPKRRAHIDPKKKQFAQPLFKQQDYKQRLNFYIIPPTVDITLEEFEEWAIHRLKGQLNCYNTVVEIILMYNSARRVRSMFFPEQEQRRDKRLHATDSGKIHAPIPELR